MCRCTPAIAAPVCDSCKWIVEQEAKAAEQKHKTTPQTEKKHRFVLDITEIKLNDVQFVYEAKIEIQGQEFAIKQGLTAMMQTDKHFTQIVMECIMNAIHHNMKIEEKVIIPNNQPKK